MSRLEMPPDELLAREQRLYIAARAMCDAFTTKEWIRMLRAAGYRSDQIHMHMINFENQNKAVNAYEGVAI